MITDPEINTNFFIIGHLSDDMFLDITVELDPRTGSFSKSVGHRNIRTAGEGSGEDPTVAPSPCSGPTAGEDGNGACTCDNIRGMTQVGDVCACNAAENFEWDANTGACVCDSTTMVKNPQKSLKKSPTNLSKIFSFENFLAKFLWWMWSDPSNVEAALGGL